MGCSTTKTAIISNWHYLHPAPLPILTANEATATEKQMRISTGAQSVFG